jgi:hypothetical protein
MVCAKFQISNPKNEKNLNLAIRKKPTTTANKQTEPIRTTVSQTIS